MIIKFKKEDNNPIYINSEHIIRFSFVDERTVIHLSDGNWVAVNEHPDDILSRVNISLKKSN